MSGATLYVSILYRMRIASSLRFLSHFPPQKSRQPLQLPATFNQFINLLFICFVHRQFAQVEVVAAAPCFQYFKPDVAVWR